MTHQVRTPTAGSVIFLPLSDENRILISQHLHGGNQVEKTFLAFSGRSILGPQKGRPPVAQKHRSRHMKNCFKGPARAFSGRATTRDCPYDEIVLSGRADPPPVGAILVIALPSRARRKPRPDQDAVRDDLLVQ